MKKNTLFLIAMTMSLLSFAQSQMSGTYTVGTGGTYDYASMADAGMAIKDAEFTGDVTLFICTDLKETINTGIVNKSNYTLTIRPDKDENRTITYTTATDNTGPTGVFVIGGDMTKTPGTTIGWASIPTRNVIVDGAAAGYTTPRLKITNEVFGTNVLLYGDVQDVIIRNCILVGRSSSTAYALVFRSENYSQTSKDIAPQNCLVENCILQSSSPSSQTVYFQGNQAHSEAGWPASITIRNSTIKAHTRGIYVRQVCNLNVEGCTFDMSNSSGGILAHAIMGEGARGTINVKGNKFIKNSTANTYGGAYGLQTITASGGADVWVIENNYFAGYDALKAISNTTKGTEARLVAVRCGDYCIVRHNTFHMPKLTKDQASQLVSASPTTLLWLAGSHKYPVQNNIFVCEETTANVSLIRGGLNENVTGNVFYHNGGNAAIVAAAPSCMAFADLENSYPTQAATSKWKNVTFTDAANGDLSLAGKSNGDPDLAVNRLAEVLTDITGKNRREKTCAGAYEGREPLPSSITLNAHPVKDYSASIVGTMKRAIQNGENTIILTHEANGTAHIYNIAHATKTVTEISQEGVIAVDPDNAGDYLAISDIALTEDGKLIASNYMRCEQGTTPATGYKVGEIRYYIWNDITAAPTRWFTTTKTANSTYADVSYTFAIKGTSTNAQLMSTAVHNNNRAARINLHTVVNGTESAYHRFGLHTTVSEYTEEKQGKNFQLTAVPLDGVWALEGELTDPTSFAVPSAVGAEYNGTALNGINLGKKYNGANYMDYNDHHLMVAPYANGDGKLAGVKVLGISDGFDAATLVTTTATDLTTPIDATRAAATAYVDGDGDLTIYLIADGKVYTFSEKEFTTPQYSIDARADHTSKGYVTGGGDYYEGEEVVLKATAKSGYYFTQWNDGNTDNPRTITVDGDKEYIAEFAEAHPRAWAYDMKLGEDGDNYTFTFKATAAGQATITFKDKDGNALAQPASQTMATVIGENKFTIAKSDFESGVDAFWFITMDGDPIPAIAEVTDQTRGIYDFYNMMGVVVDNNTDSKDFGKIYVQASLNGKSGGITDRAKEQKAGIFIYNQDLDELNDPSNTGYKPTVPSGYTEIGSSYSAFQRLNIHPKTGDLVYSHAIADKPAVFAINRDDMTGAVTNLLTGVADMTRSVAHCFDADGTLFVMDFAENQGAVYKVINGDATRITEISSKFINAHITMASDGRGGLWISQNRAQMDGAPYYYQLVHVNNVGEYDWAVNKETPHDFVGSSSRGALAYDADRQILAQGRNGKVELYTVSYAPNITLTPLYTIANDDLGNNIDGLAFDYAGDLYVVNSSKEKFQKFSLPTADNICTVAAPALEAVRFTPVYTVSVASNNNEWGIANGGGTFEEGQSATITATAATNYKFVNWTKGSTEVSTENPYTFSVTETATYTANFVEKTKYTIDVTYDNTMGIVSGAGSYYEGAEVTLTARANGGYVFVKWSDEVTDESRAFNASENLNLTAIFKIATPRAWAYDLNMVEDGDDYKFTFTPTSAGNATILFTDKDGTPVSPTQEVVGAVTAGEPKTVSVAKSQFTGTKDIYWSVKVESEAITKMAEITDPTKGIYDIVAPQGIAVDNNTESDYFGQVYVAAATDGTVARGAQTRGVFVYNPILNELNAPNIGYLPANVTLTNTTRQAIHRVAVSPTSGQVAFAYNISGSTAVWEMNPENLAGDAVNMIEGSEITKANSLCYDAEGALYVMDNANTTTGGKIYKIQDGVASVFAEAQTGCYWATEENAMTPDGRGGLWIAQNRWQVDTYPALSHVNKDGIVDFAVTTSSPEELKALFPHDDNNASYRGQCAYHVADDILAFAGNKEAVLFKITYDANNVPTNLEKLMSTGKLGTNIDGVAFDYAGDLYVASESTHRFYKFVVPTNDNTCTVPAPMSQFIQKEARYTVTVVANEAAMGTVSAGGEYKADEIITLTATANADYRFVNWTKGADVISTDASFSYTVPAENVTIVANFELKPLEMVGTVKRAVQIDDATIVLTHESNGTAHIYNVVNGEVKNELSQSSVVPVDTENAGDMLAISDIAATDDGKLVAINKIVCQASDDQVDAGYKRGETKVYLWNDLAADPTLWFTSKMSSNWFRSVQGHTMAFKGTSTNGTLFTTGVTATGVKFRYSVYNVIDGVYTEPAVNDSEHYYFTKGDAQTTDILGANYEINASPLASENWILDGGKVDPFEITDPLTYNSQVTAGTTITEDLGKKYNGATYLTIQGVNLMVAPYADGEKVGGVTVLNISGGLNKATELAYQALGSSITATAVATAVKVNGNELLVTLVTDNKVQTLPITVELPIHTREVPAGYYATVCLPYNLVKVTGATLFKVAGKDNNKVYLDEVLASETEAGKPYIFLTDADTQVFYYGDSYTSEPGSFNTLYGTFVKLEGAQLDGMYMLQSNKIVKCAATGCWIDPYRAYFNGTELEALGKPGAQMPGRRRVSLGATEENTTTGSEDVVTPNEQVIKVIENGQVIIIRDGVKYNAQGIKL